MGVRAGKEYEDEAGSPYWMAPEVIEMCPATPAADIWSVGATIIELLTGSPPYFELAAMPALFRIVQDACPPLPKDMSAALEDFLRQCFRKDPGTRMSAKHLMSHAWIRRGIARRNANEAHSPRPPASSSSSRAHAGALAAPPTSAAISQVCDCV